MLKYCFEKRNVLSVRKYVQKANSVDKITKTVEEDETIQKTQNFDSIPGPRSYPVIGTLYKYCPIIGK